MVVTQVTRRPSSSISLSLCRKYAGSFPINVAVPVTEVGLSAPKSQSRHFHSAARGQKPSRSAGVALNQATPGRLRPPPSSRVPMWRRARSVHGRLCVELLRCCGVRPNTCLFMLGGQMAIYAGHCCCHSCDDVVVFNCIVGEHETRTCPVVGEELITSRLLSVLTFSGCGAVRCRTTPAESSLHRLAFGEQGATTARSCNHRRVVRQDDVDRMHKVRLEVTVPL